MTQRSPARNQLGGASGQSLNPGACWVRGQRQLLWYADKQRAGLLRHLVSGKALPEVANANGLTEAAGASVQSDIFAKLGVTRLTDLMIVQLVILCHPFSKANRPVEDAAGPGVSAA